MLSISCVPKRIASRRATRINKVFLHAAAIILLGGFSGSACAQAITENFDNIALLGGNGWFIQNNSNPVGTNTWFQGTPTNATPDPGPFNAFNGADNAYIGVNFASTSGGTGIISNWLGMPNRTLRNGDVLTFYTRKPTIGSGMTDYPDRLEVRLSTNGASTNVGASASLTGDFTTLLLSINPTLVTNVYPQVWTQYTITISGLPAPTSGRMAFRYYVTSAGPTGSNSDYIGIDALQYTPYVCPAFTMTAGGALTNGTWGTAYSTILTQTGALGAPSFAVVAGVLPPGMTLSAAGTISGTPTGTGTFNFTAMVADASGCTGSQAYSITIAAAQPGAPESVGASAGDAQVVVAWLPPTIDGGDPSFTYDVTCTGGNVVSASGDSPLTLTGLVNGTDYTCAVTATNSAGPGPAGISNGFTPMGSQTLTFPAQSVPSHWFVAGSTFAIAPLASSTDPNSGEPIIYSSLSQSVCSVSGTMVTMAAVGTCTIAADQAGNTAFTAAAQVTAQVELLEPTEADLWIEKTATTATADIGDTAVYSISAGNTGLANAVNVRVLDVPPQRLDLNTVTWQCVEAIGTACPVPGSGTGQLDATISSLPKDAAVRFALSGQVVPATDPEDDYTEFFNTATVSLPPGSGLTDPVAGNNQSVAGVQVLDVIFKDGFEALTP